MRTCIILGAGSTLANASYFRPERMQDTLPPLDYTFFTKIADRKISIPADLEAYARGLPGGSPFDAPAGGGRMEEFLRDLFHDFLQERAAANSLPVRAYRQLIEIYARVLRETTDWMKDRQGPIGQLIAEASRCSNRVDIITFNHDLVIENEILKRSRLRTRWCIERSYGTFSQGRTLIQTTGLAHFPQHSSDCDHDRPLVIHKMHGSLNWYVQIRAKAPTPGVLAGEVTSPDVMITIDRSVREVRNVQMRPTGSGRRRWYVWPVIVPPIYSKQALIEAFMPSVWTDARDALTNSDQILFCGYSLPAADVEAEKLVQRAIGGNVPLPWVGVIDPAPGAVARYATLLPEQRFRRFPSIDSFLSSDEPFGS